MLAIGLSLAGQLFAQLSPETARGEMVAAGLGWMGPGPSAALQPRIVNGVEVFGLPTTLALLTPGDFQYCSATLVGCSTVVTAGHCVCATDGSDCSVGEALPLSPGQITVFAQHGGFYGVESIHVPPSYVFGAQADVAVLKLNAAVDGITPTPINTVGRPPAGSSALIAGFGLTFNPGFDNGVKRAGYVETIACSVVDDDEHLCWSFSSPLGDPGQDSNTCSGDSGGPLFADMGSGPVLAGVTSGGIASNCQPTDESFDSDVFVNRFFVQAAAGSDLGGGACGDLPQVTEGAGPAQIFGFQQTATNQVPIWNVSHEVPPGTRLLRVTLNGADARDFDLYLKAGAMATPSDNDCESERPGPYEACEIEDPTPGTWWLRIEKISTGSGFFQASAVSFAAPIFADGFESGGTTSWSATTP